ncbi:hypothetical protein GCM10009720_18010 [Yaniella flava]|uniref:Uncharacterized protein n=1 Tax=Yaniella flava TaxID=287930 RepID=A0ABP5G0N2_9MICC
MAVPVVHIEERQAIDILHQSTEKGADSVTQMPLFHVQEHGQMDHVPKPAVMRLHDEIDANNMVMETVTQVTTAHLFAEGRKGLEPLENIADDVDETRYMVITQQLVVDLDNDYLTDEIHDLIDQILSFPRLKKLEERRAALDEDIEQQRELSMEANRR